MKLLNIKTRHIIDLSFGVIFMPLLVLLGPARYWLFSWPVFFVLVVLSLCGCYFFTTRVNYPNLIVRRQYVRILLYITGVIAVVSLLCYYPHPEVDFYTPALSRYQTAIRDYNISISLWLMFSLVMMYALTTSFVRALYEQRLQKARIETLKSKAELAVFKAQISPHFLFNTLNSLYSLVIGTSEKAEEAFIKFTDILKYTYISIDNDYVPIKEEKEYIQNYIDLQKLRLNSHTTVAWKCDIENEMELIPPMILLTFVENCFKYGTSTSKDCNIEIALSVKDGVLGFDTRNSIMKRSEEFRTQMPVGIENCHSRLDALYKGRYSLTTNDDGNYFEVKLKLNLK